MDANRNFGYEWGGEGASNVTCSDGYDGPEPFSESETQAIRDLLLGLGDQVAFYQNTHSYSQLIMYPWGYTEDLPEDADDQDNLATIVREKSSFFTSFLLVFKSMLISSPLLFRATKPSLTRTALSTRWEFEKNIAFPNFFQTLNSN